MFIRGEDGLGRERFTIPLGHGEAPSAVTERLGWRLTEPLSTEGTVEDLLLRVRVQRIRPRTRQAKRPPQAAGLVIAPGEIAQTRQRIAAYALTLSSLGVLSTQFSAHTAAAGMWGLPGGGLDPGETPVAAVVREVWEETSQQISVGPLLAVQTDHWIGRAPHGNLEDFQAIRLFYRAECASPSTPVVIDVNGTTSQAAWVPSAKWSRWKWTPAYRAVMRASGLIARSAS